ncbi:UNVERIFIED_CONTAM: hypothetical protein GTU68_056879 [Idotea baltica]|nr:hypothetical protein [Idotea baltica]
MSKIALVAGGTGLVGSHLVELLADNKEYSEVKVLVRKGSKIHGAKLTVLEIDYDRLSEYESQLQADVVFCCLGTTMKKAGSKAAFEKVDFTYPLELAKAAQIHGAKQFHLITAMGANLESRIYYNQIKGKTEAAIEELNFENLNIYRPSLLLGDRKEQRFGERVGTFLSWILRPFFIEGLKKYRAIHAGVVATAMLHISMKNLQGTQIFLSDAIQEQGVK